MHFQTEKGYLIKNPDYSINPQKMSYLGKKSLLLQIVVKVRDIHNITKGLKDLSEP